MSEITQLELQQRFGEHCRKLRIEKQMTLTGISHIMENTPQEVNSIEKGERNVTLKTVIGYAKALGIHPAKLWLFDVQPLINDPIPSIKKEPREKK